MRTKLVVFFLLLTILQMNLNSAFACFSITDDLNFPNPVLNANFSLLPDISPFTDCWNGTIRIRSNKNGWRLVASRSGPDPINVSGDSKDNIKADDITLNYKLKSFGMADPNGAVLVSPFTSETNLSYIQNGTLIVSGIEKSGGSCSSTNQNFYQLKKDVCLFRDFVFNVGEYNGQISYLLIAP
ncbi:MAG: hypothetical protein A3B68_09675 [Candidatus Melainabacteria bacterium RIFCSPHIGHO2_02_FULL_34_12]|nr:MAG: hypothetical protein A3B68_09675 [Candidatus Melainabacteria bacterium RIFCSPHIGHO2_02_FULL_34_12]